jgi:hypothetical protein
MFRVLRPGGRLMLIDGFRDAPWGWFIYDVCVAGVEGNVHHASRRRMRELFAAAGFEGTEQTVHRGPAPFLLTEAVRPAVPAPGRNRPQRIGSRESLGAARGGFFGTVPDSGEPSAPRQRRDLTPGQ